MLYYFMSGDVVIHPDGRRESNVEEFVDDSRVQSNQIGYDGGGSRALASTRNHQSSSSSSSSSYSRGGMRY